MNVIVLMLIVVLINVNPWNKCYHVDKYWYYHMLFVVLKMHKQMLGCMSYIYEQMFVTNDCVCRVLCV